MSRMESSRPGSHGDGQAVILGIAGFFHQFAGFFDVLRVQRGFLRGVPYPVTHSRGNKGGNRRFAVVDVVDDHVAIHGKAHRLADALILKLFAGEVEAQVGVVVRLIGDDLDVGVALDVGKVHRAQGAGG